MIHTNLCRVNSFFFRLAMARKPLFIILRNSDRDNTENSKNVLVLVPLLWQKFVNNRHTASNKTQREKNKVFANQNAIELSVTRRKTKNKIETTREKRRKKNQQVNLHRTLTINESVKNRVTME